jgi:ABC-2 type transport system permease protein
MRWLLVKDLQILRRSPLLVGLLVVYPIAIALMIGFALSSPPSKPTVAFYNQVPKGQGTISLGSQKLDVAGYARDLLRSVQPIKVHSEAEAIAAVRDGRALAAVVIPADLPQQVQNLITQGVGNPTVQLYLNSKDPIERQYVDQAISSRITQVEQDVSKQVLRVAVTDLQQVLNGGGVQILGQTVRLLGLRNARTIVQGTLASLPRDSPLRPALAQVISFADLAIQGLAFAKPVLGTIGTPLTVNETELAGRTTPTDAYAAAIAVIVSLMFVAMLLASGMLALERSEHAALMAFLISLPIAFVALVPASAVSGTLKTVLDVIAFLFPFKAALQAVSNAFSATSPPVGLPLLHLAVLTAVFGGLALLAMRRFATR